jgi:hypothetical protein
MTDLRAKIFEADDITKELLEVPEWGVTVEIRSMTAAQRATLTEGISSTTDKVDVSNMYAKTVIATVFDPETGLPVFTEKDREAILSKNGAVIERLATKALGSSGLSEKAVDTSTGSISSRILRDGFFSS